MCVQFEVDLSKSRRDTDENVLLSKSKVPFIMGRSQLQFILLVAHAQ